MGEAIGGVVDRMIHSHRDDAAGVALDVLCIALSLAFIPTGISALGLIGLVGGSVLLATDGSAYAMEMNGDDETGTLIKEKTETIRIIATVMTLPDIAFGGIRAVRELQEIKALQSLDRTTAASAEALATRRTRAGRAARYEQIAERAHLRAQIRSKQVAALMKLEMTPRSAGMASLMLSVRHEIGSDESAMHRMFKQLRVHATAVHR